MPDVDLFPGLLGMHEDARESAPEGEPGNDAPDFEAIEAQLDAGVCPWCDEEFDRPAQHASQRHADAWAAYREAAE